MKKLKFALALAFAPIAMTAAPASAQTTATAPAAADARVTSGVNGLCTVAERYHNQTCTAEQRAQLTSILTSFLANPPTSQEDYNAKITQLRTDIAAVFGMTVEQFTNPQISDERRAQIQVLETVDGICEQAATELEPPQTCTAEQRSALVDLFTAEQGRPSPTTEEEVNARMLALVNGIRGVFGLPPVQMEQDAPAANTNAPAARAPRIVA